MDWTGRKMLFSAWKSQMPAPYRSFQVAFSRPAMKIKLVPAENMVKFCRDIFPNRSRQRMDAVMPKKITGM